MKDSVTVDSRWAFHIGMLNVALMEIQELVQFKNRQISLQHRRGEDPHHASSVHGDATILSSVTDRDGKVLQVFAEEEFNVFNERFKDTYFYEVYEAMTAELGEVFRMRLLRLPAQSALFFHSDPTKHRFHVPIVTNSNCFFFVNESGKRPMPRHQLEVPNMGTYHMPADGRVYRLRADRQHTAFNGHLVDDRIHLFMATYS